MASLSKTGVRTTNSFNLSFLNGGRELGELTEFVNSDIRFLNGSGVSSISTCKPLGDID